MSNKTQQKPNILSRVKSTILRRDSYVLNQPLSVEDSIPDDLLHSTHEKINLNNFIKHLSTLYIRSNFARLLVLFGAILSCILYVVETYVKDQDYLLFSFVIDIFIFALFATDYIFNILYVTIKWKYILSVQGIIDLLSLLSIINIFVVSADLSFLPLFRLLRVIKVLRFFHIVSVMSVDRPKPPSASEAIVFEIVSLIVSLILAIFLSSSLLYTLIKQDGHSFIFTPDHEFSMKKDMTFFDCVYVVFVIVATLGFGDFVPNNFLGRLFVVLLLSATAIYIPTRISQLVDTIGKKPHYMNEYIPESGQPHIVIFATLTQENFQKLITLILAEGSNAAEIVEDAVPIALMSPIQPSPQLQLLLVHPMYSRKVQFFVGSAKSQIDLARVRACEAKAILIFNDYEKVDKIDVVDQDDYSTKLKVVSIINYLSHELALRKQNSRPVIICQTVSHEVCTSLLNFGVDHIISITNMKYTLLAYAALFPGFLSLFVSLVVPSTIYTKKGATANQKKWKNEFEWGNSFELLEIPIASNTSSDMKRLSFSQTCRFLYERSNGTVICVAVADHCERSGVILNPERRIRIGDCKSLFIICNDVDLALAMLKTENLRTVMRKLRSRREFGSTKGKNYTLYGIEIENSEALPLPKNDSFKIAVSRKRTSTAVSTPDVHLNIHNQTPITFRRHSSCFKKEVGVTYMDNELSPHGTVTSPQSISTSEAPGIISEEQIRMEKIPVVRVQSNILIQDWDYKPASEGRHAGEYSIISQSSVSIDKNEFISHRRFKLHTVLVCAFSPQFSIPRIAAAIETFLNAFRSKSSDTIVVLAAYAVAIEEYIQKRVKERNEIFDPALVFVEGMPNSVRGLQSVDVCHARCIVIIGNEYIDKESDDDENKEVNRDLYIVLAALELDSILKFYIKILRKHNRPAELPIVIQELYNESTASFLPDIYQVFVKKQNIWENYEKKIINSNRGISRDEAEEDDNNIDKSQFRRSFESFIFHQKLKTLHKLQNHSYVPNPAYSQGRVLTGPVIDTLTVQMLYNPNLLEFWQVAMGMKKENDSWGGGSNISVLNSTSSEHDPYQSGHFDVLEIPQEFHGTFGELFQYLLICYGTITIGLFRYPENQSSYVAILPPNDSIVLPDDHAMVLLTKRPTENVLGKEDVLSALHEGEQEIESKNEKK